MTDEGTESRGDRWPAGGSLAAVPLDDGQTRVVDLGRGAIGQDGIASGPRYRIVRAHSGGGLGVVSVAVDRELDRPVALKEIREKEADSPTSRARFVREAEITAKLEHPGIVPVYGHGRHDDGRPYYAMRLIRGDSLKDAIERFHRPADDDARPGGPHGPSPPAADPGSRASKDDFRSLAFRELIGRFVAICETIEYAHSRGVLHRDLKPTNIMLGPFGETLVVDWGLAKIIGEPASRLGSSVDDEAESDAKVSSRVRLSEWSGSTGGTIAGSAVGTPQFMSPEQAAGESEGLGPATDVYGLGATLYAILTMRAPVEGDDLEDLRTRVRRGDVPHPRALVPAVPRALEAVCRKAMALEPGDRYASARALGDDLKRWLAHEPVSVLREDPFELMARWARRHRSAAWAAIAALAVVAAVASGATAVVARAFDKERRAALSEASARDRATGSFRRALDLLHLYPRAVAEYAELHGDDPKLRELRLKLLREALAYDGAFVASHEGDPLFEGELALAYGQLAELTAELDDPGKALPLFERAAGRLDRQIAQSPAPASRGDLVRRRVSLALGHGRALIKLGRRGEAEAVFRAAVELAEGQLSRIAPREADQQADRYAIVQLCHELAVAVDTPERRHDARHWNERAGAELEWLIRHAPTDPRYRRDLSLSAYRRALVAEEDGDPTAAAADFDRALDLIDALVRERPESVQDRYLAGLYRHGMAVFTERRDDPGRAETLFAESLERLREASGRAPDNVEYANQLAYALYRRGTFLRRRERAEEALDSLVDSTAKYDALLAVHPDLVDAQDEQVSAYIALGSAALELGRLGRAEQALRRAERLNLRYLQAHPDRPDGAYDRAQWLGAWCRLMSKLGPERRADAEAAAREECRIREALHHSHPTSPKDAAWLAAALDRLGRLLLERSATDEAGRAFGSAAEAMSIAIALDPDEPAYPREQAEMIERRERATRSPPVP